MNRLLNRLTITIFVAAGLVGCGADGGTPTDAGADRDGSATGGRGGAGGRAGSGGATASGGASAASGGASGGGGTGGAIAGNGGNPGATGGVGQNGGASSGGASGNGGTSATGGRGGGAATGGAPATGGASATGGRVGTGGAGGSAGAATTGGAPATGGAATGGAATGGAATGGAATGGAATGGAATGGAATGGAATGGATTGGAPGTGGAGTGGAGTGGGPVTTNASMYVVAHADDDLLFINPDLSADIKVPGKAVRTVVITAGDGGSTDPAVWMAREPALRAAYAAMAGVANTWSCAIVPYAGKPTSRCSLTPRPLLELVFMRLLDGGVSNLFTTNASRTVDNTATYTAAELIATMADIQAQWAPASVGTLDGTRAHGFDHPDHVATGNFAFDVARADGVARQLTMYRGYTMFQSPFFEPENLSTAQYMEKLSYVQVYQAGPLDPGFDEWCRRFYPVRALTGGPAPLRNAGSQCLQASAATDGAAVTLAACGGALQTWTVSATGRVLGPSGLCLGVASTGSGIVVETCSGAADQRWSLLSDGQLHGTRDTCVTATGANLSSAQCMSDGGQPRSLPPLSQTWGF